MHGSINPSEVCFDEHSISKTCDPVNRENRYPHTHTACAFCVVPFRRNPSSHTTIHLIPSSLAHTQHTGQCLVFFEESRVMGWATTCFECQT